MSTKLTFVSYALIGVASAPVDKFLGGPIALIFAITCAIAFGVGARR